MEQEKKVCCIFNLGPHYNQQIYSLLRDEVGCDFYFGDKLSSPIELLDYSEFSGYKSTLRNIILFKNFYWQKGAISLCFKQYKKYIITGEPYCLSSWIVLITSIFTKKKVFLWTHGWYGDESFLKKIVKKLYFSFSSGIFLYGDYAKNLMIMEGIKKEKLHVIYNSLSYTKQVEIRNMLSKTSLSEKYFSNNHPVIIFIGRITKSKKIDLLILALSELKKKGIFCNAIVIGKEVDELDIKKQIKDLGLSENVLLFGECYDEFTIAKLIYNSDLTVIPGDVGLSAMHSLVYGTPVITHDCFYRHGPEFEAITPDINGDFFKYDSVDDLVSKIQHWITITSSQREFVTNYSYDLIEKKYNPDFQIKVFKSVLQ